MTPAYTTVVRYFPDWNWYGRYVRKWEAEISWPIAGGKRVRISRAWTKRGAKRKAIRLTQDFLLKESI